MTKTIFSLLLLFITFIPVFTAKAQTPTPTPAIIPDVIPILPPPLIPPAKIRGGINDKTAPEVEARLKKIPDAQQTKEDVDIRIELIEYYDQKDTPEAKKAKQAHRLWLVRNRPEKTYYRELGWWSNNDDLKNPDYVALREEWLRQVGARKTNEKVRLAAAQFLSSIDAPLAEKILREGQQINPNLYEYSELLMGIYQEEANAATYDYETNREKASDAEIDAALRKLLAEGEKALAIISRDEDLVTSTIRLELVIRLAETALELNDVKKARVFSETILSGTKEEAPPVWINTDKAIYYGNNLLGRVALREGNTAKAKEHLSASVKFYDEENFELETPELDLAAELLAKGEKQAVLDYLARLEQLAKGEDNLKVFRRWQRLIRRNSFPYWRGERF